LKPVAVSAKLPGMKVSIIGVGNVGATLAYTLTIRGLTDELALMDQRPEVAQGEALDLLHAEAFTSQPVLVRAGGFDATAGSDLLVLTCSAPWKSTYASRADLARDNLRTFESLVPALVEQSPEAKLLVISNPVDVMTYHALRISRLPAHRVFGTGTLIDSARFRAMLSAEVGIHPDDLRAYILGEHGESQFPALSLAQAGGERLEESEIACRLAGEASRWGWAVVNQKGYTSFAISMAAALVVEAVARDTRRTMPLSVLIDGFLEVRDVCLSLPVVVGREGVVRVLQPKFRTEEADAFRHCAGVVAETIRASQEDVAE
jgi:L-lactate dehydrogenase